MADQKTPEQREKDWWDAWWKADYSWEGLAGHEIGGDGGLHGEKTLQDYWRRDPATGVVRNVAEMQTAGELVADADGRLWHIVHLPKAWRDGAPTWKADLKHADWARVEALVDARLRAGVETESDFSGEAKGAEGRALLRGAVIGDFNGHPEGRDTVLHINARQMAVLGRTDCESQAFSSASFDSARFPHEAWLTSASFAGHASFDSASFAGDAWFASASFAKSAGFSAAAEASENGENTQTLNLKLVQSPGADDTPDMAAPGMAATGEIKTPATDGPLKRRSFRQVSFAGAKFERDADFSNRSFLAATDFSNAVFGGQALFHDARLHQDTNFNATDFRTPQHRLSDIFAGIKDGDLQYRTPTRDERLAQRDAHFAAYERAYRTLKLAMEGHRARREEARFYRLELEARRQRPALRIRRAERKEHADDAKNETESGPAYWHRPAPRDGENQAKRAAYKDVTWAEKAASYLYGWTSGYGDSLLNPMVSLAVLCGVFIMIYGLLSGSFFMGTPPMCAPDAECGAGKVLETLAAFSAERTFLPFVQQEESDAATKWWFDATRDAPLIPFVLGFVHRLLAAAFIFLFLLALRRRFQMN